jgi:formate-dependent nitrite reductase membrane component NrfD
MQIFNAQTKWRWGVAIYLFLAGLGAGAYLIGVLMDAFSDADWGILPKVGVALGFPCVALAGFVKLNNLGNPKAAWAAWKKPNCSWIARGTLLLAAFLGISFFHFILWVWPGEALATAETTRHVLGLVGAFIALCMILYSGILLTAVRPIAFWSTAILPVLFLVSALLSGAMGLLLVGLIFGQVFEGPLAQVEHLIIGLIIAKAVFVAIYLQSTHRTAEARASVRRVLKGELAPLFWWGVAVLGVIAPLVLGILALEVGVGLAAVGAVAGLLGSLFLRQVILAGGIHAPLRAGPFEVPLPIV